MLVLQRLAGNAAVTALVERRASVQRTGLADAIVHHLGQPTPGALPVQRDLKADMRAMLTIVGPVHYEGLITKIRVAPVAERQTAVADSTVLGLIGTRLSGVWATSIVSSLLEGSQNWANPPMTDFYTHFVVQGKSGPLPSAATMNCWESILYAAHLAGVLTASWIKNYYVSAGALPGTTVDPTPALWAQLGFSTSLPRYLPSTGNVPTVGQLVFYVTSGSSIPGHVAVCMGGNEVMSLWTKPAGVHQVQRIKITDLAGAIYYGNAPW